MIRFDIDMPLGCIYEKNGKTEYCPLCNHYDVPFCQFLDDDEAVIGVDERPCYCPLSAEPQELTGKWIYHTDDLFPTESTMECDQCHATQPLTCDDNFCPNCGCKMGGTDGR